QPAELERAIAAAAAGAKPAPAEPVAPLKPAPAAAPVPSPAPAKTSSVDDALASAAKADAILDDYRVAPDTMKSDIKKGCFLYFFGALGFVALVVTVLYFALSRR